jgi:hypothetical protein
MNRNAAMRTVTGLITLFIYAMIGTIAWPNLPWLTYLMGILGLVRLVLLVRQWPSKA